MSPPKDINVNYFRAGAGNSFPAPKDLREFQFPKEHHSKISFLPFQE
jgi:hypothetical protein